MVILDSLLSVKILDSLALEGELSCLEVGSVLEFHCKVDSLCWAWYIHSSNNKLIEMTKKVKYSLEMFQLIYKTLQLDLHNIQGEIFGPVDFRKVGYDESHSELSLVDIVKVATRIMTIFPKQCIKLAVEGFMWIIAFLHIHNRPDFIIFGSLWYSIWQRAWKSTYLFNKLLNGSGSGHFGLKRVTLSVYSERLRLGVEAKMWNGHLK